MSDVLQDLKRRLDAERSALEAARNNIALISIAIEAIEKSGATTSVNGTVRRKKTKRGSLKRAILDCLRREIGSIGGIFDELEAAGMPTTKGSISNALQRMLRKDVTFEPAVNEWRLLSPPIARSELSRLPETNSAPHEGEAVNGSGV